MLVQHAPSPRHCDPTSSQVPGWGGVPKHTFPLHKPDSQCASCVQKLPAIAFGGKFTLSWQYAPGTSG